MSETAAINNKFSIENTQKFIVQVSCDAIEENIDTTQTTEQASVVVNDALTTLSASWTTDMPDPSKYANNPTLQKQMIEMMNTFNSFHLSDGKPNPATLTPTNIHKFISTYLNPDNEALINTMSSSFITSVILDVQTAYKGAGANNKCSTDLAACNAINTLIGSTSTEETQPEQTLSRTDNSLLQQCQSAMTGYSGIGDLANDWSSSYIALTSQQY